MLVGFVGMMIFGVALHVLPRFTGRALLSERLADANLVLANLGLVVLVLGWLGSSPVAARIGGAVLWSGFLAFAVNVIGTVRPWARPNADGTIERVNPAVAGDPGLANVAPYSDAWLMLLRPDDVESAYAQLATGPAAIDALKAWIDKYDLQCMRCTQ